jgi:hypothetical protein
MRADTGLVGLLQHNASYVASQAAFVTQQLTTAPATYNFVVSHYPLFGTSRQYGAAAAHEPLAMGMPMRLAGDSPQRACAQVYTVATAWHSQGSSTGGSW